MEEKELIGYAKAHSPSRCTIIQHFRRTGCQGSHFAAQLIPEAGTNWLKLEIHPDPRHLLPDPVGNLEKPPEELAKLGFGLYFIA